MILKLKDWELELLKNDSKGVLKDSVRICEFATETHQVYKGCLYSGYYADRKDARVDFERLKEDAETGSFFGTAKEILEKVNEFNEIEY